MSNKYLLKTQINHLEYIIFTGDRTLWFSKWSHSYLWVISPDRTLGQGGTVTSRERLLCWQIFLSSSLWLPGPTLKELVWWSRLVFGPGTLWQDSTTVSLGSLGHLTVRKDWLAENLSAILKAKGHWYGPNPCIFIFHLKWKYPLFFSLQQVF